MPETVSCQSCGHHFAKGDRFCPKCGTEATLGTETAGGLETRVEATNPTVCGSCSAPMGRSDRFCPKCGSERSEEATIVSHVSLRNAQAAHLADSTRGEFEIMQQLGVGAMGSVYLAKDVALGRHVAIKLIASQLLQDESMVSRFQLEAQTVASLRHPNIVNVHAVRQAEDLHYFVMDFIDGPALRSIVKTHAPLEVPIVQALLYQVGSALDYAHHRGRGVIHRDIKPANIMVDLEGDAFVTDFGISKITESQSGLTQTGATIGTPEYMSPEQCRGEELTGASDQYALGIVAYEMLCGKTPFSGSQYFIMVAHTSEEPTPIQELRPDCPAHVAETVHRMLAKTPEERWPDLESAMAAMGGAPLGRKDPIRKHITALAGTTAEVRALDTVSPLTPMPGRSQEVVDTATSVTVHGVPSRVEEGDSFLLSADVRGATQGSIPGMAVAWSSTDPSIAVVSGGRVQALKAGTAVISASAGSVTNSVSVMVAEASAVAVTIEPSTLNVASGERASLKARVHDRQGRDLERAIRWLTSDATVASVTREGEVVATGSGVATITADSGGVTGTAEVIVKGAGARIPVQVKTAEKRPFYRHPATIGVAVLLLGAAGVFGAMSAGLFALGGGTDGGGDGVQAPAVASVALVGMPETLAAGDSVQLVATALDSDGNEIPGQAATFAVDDPGLAEIRGGWLVAGDVGGDVTLTASIGDVRRELDLIVSGPTQVAAADPAQETDPALPPGGDPSVATNAGGGGSRGGGAAQPPAGQPEPQRQPPSAQPTVPRPTDIDIQLPAVMEFGARQNLSAQVRGAGGAVLSDQRSQLRWESSNPQVLAIDGGALEAVGVGSTEISASLGSLRRSLEIAVEAPVRSVTIQGGNRALEVGDSEALSSTVTGPASLPLPLEPVTWTSSAEGVATVDPTGLVSAVGPGTAEITALAGGFSDRIQVEVAVVAAPPLPTLGQVQPLVDGYITLLNDKNEDQVAALHGDIDNDRRDDLIDLMGRTGFTASLDGVDPPTEQGGAVAATFMVTVRVRRSFGGEDTSIRRFRAVFTPSAGGWSLASVVLLEG